MLGDAHGLRRERDQEYGIKQRRVIGDDELSGLPELFGTVNLVGHALRAAHDRDEKAHRPAEQRAGKPLATLLRQQPQHGKDEQRQNQGADAEERIAHRGDYESQGVRIPAPARRRKRSIVIGENV